MRISFFIITIMCIKSIASDQLTFLQDTVEFKKQSLFITNKTDYVVSIDTLHFTWELDGVKQSAPMGTSFLMYHINDINREFIDYPFHEIIERPDTSFCFYAKIENQEIMFQPHEQIVFSEFFFGRTVVGYSGVLRGQRSNGNVSIRMTYINNQSGRDTVIFVGNISDMFFGGVIHNNAACFRISKERTLEKDIFLLSGRKMTISGKINNRKLIPCNLYFTKSGRVPIAVNKFLR